MHISPGIFLSYVQESTCYFLNAKRLSWGNHVIRLQNRSHDHGQVGRVGVGPSLMEWPHHTMQRSTDRICGTVPRGDVDPTTWRWQSPHSPPIPHLTPLERHRIFLSYVPTSSHLCLSLYSYFIQKVQHFTLFPKPVAQTVQKFGVEQFRLVFTRGRWQSDAWGAAIMDAPSGAQLAASFLDAQEAESGWHGLIHSLAGMFCASLGSLNDQSRLDPYYSYLDMTAQNERIAMDAQRQVELQWQEELIGNLTDHFGDHRPVDAEWARLAAMGKSTKKFYANRERVLRQSSPAAPASRLFYGELPEETVCTENLTPWSKLLPCRAESGMAKLLHSTRLLSGQYYSMGAHFQYRVPDHCSLADLTSCDDVTLELIQTLTVVFRTETLKEYSIASLFGEEEMRACVLSQGQSHVHVQMPKRNDEILTISPEPTRIEGDIRTFDLSPSDPLSLQFSISNRRQNRKNLRLGSMYFHFADLIPELRWNSPRYSCCL